MMEGSNLTDNSQTQAASRCFGAQYPVKTLKDPFPEFDGDAWSRVFDPEYDECVSIDDADFDGTIGWCIANGIINDTTNQDPERRIISHYNRFGRRRRKFNFNILFQSVGSQISNDFCCQFVQIKRLDIGQCFFFAQTA